MKKIENIKRGREAKFFGDVWESWIEGQHNAAVVLGILAHYFHPEPKFNFIDGRWQPTKASVSDFVGVFEAESYSGPSIRGPGGGRTLAEEAKSVKGDCMRKSIVEPDQAKHLEAVARAGGLALLVGEFRLDTVRMRFACPWLDIPWEVKRSTESVSPILMAPWDVSKYPDCYLKRWHPGGKRSGTWSAVRKRNYPTE